MILSKWVNKYYLEEETIFNIQEGMRAKPDIKYAVLDNFFNINMIDQLIEQHQSLPFSESDDRRSGTDKPLPYDGAVVWANTNHFGSELFFDKSWHEYCIKLCNANLQSPISTEVKLRWHKPLADGFWIHTDSTIRQIALLTYFNKNWKVSDGGLLQLWRIDEALANNIFTIDNPEGRMNFLNEHTRIRTSSPGGGFQDNKQHDLILIDQIVPAYNRLVICNFQNNPTYHSVTPSNGKVRLGFVQWLGTNYQ